MIGSDNSCTYYNESSFDIILDQNIDTIYIRKIMEISFDLQINELCSGYCHIFAIYPRLPLIYTVNNQLWIEFVSSSQEIYASTAYPIIVDGNYHRLYYKHSATDRILKVDNITYINITNGSYDYNDEYIYTTRQITAVWGNPNAHQYVYNATIRNLCIKSLFPKPTPAANVQSQSELMSYLEDIRQHNETVYFYNNDPYLPTYWSKYVGNYGIILSSLTADIAYYHIGDITNSTITLYYNDLIVCKTQNYPFYITYQSTVSESCTFNIIFESNSTVFLEAVNELYLSRIRLQNTDYLWSHHHNQSLIYCQFTLYSTFPLPIATNGPSSSPSNYPSNIPTTPTRHPFNIPTTSPISHPSNIPTIRPTTNPTDYSTTIKYQANTIYSTLFTLSSLGTRDSAGNSNNAVSTILTVISCTVLVLLIIACTIMYKTCIYKKKKNENISVAISNDNNVDSGQPSDIYGVRKQTDSNESMYGAGYDNDNEGNVTVTIDGTGNTPKTMIRNRSESEIEDMYKNNNIGLTPNKETIDKITEKELNVNGYIQEDQDESEGEDIVETTQCPTPCEVDM